MSDPWWKLDLGGLDGPGALQRQWFNAELRPRSSVDDEWGRSESIDPDNVGDIADEGTGHRG